MTRGRYGLAISGSSSSEEDLSAKDCLGPKVAIDGVLAKVGLTLDLTRVSPKDAISGSSMVAELDRGPPRVVRAKFVAARAKGGDLASLMTVD